MDTQRRAVIASGGAELLEELHADVVASWVDLLPASATWEADALARAHRASRAALAALLVVFEQGDLDDRSWDRVRTEVLAYGHASPEEAEELLRTVRIAGVERLVDLLDEGLRITQQERWELQREASAFVQELLGRREEIDAAAFDAMLADLERSGPDIR
ncbi:hypothetical protein BH23ACT7_BH23ACT7_04390 [soil metagenome]